MADVVSTPRLGPQDHGRRMTLREFKEIEFEPGYLYELAHGQVVVADFPSVFHMVVVLAIRNALIQYQLAHPTRVFAVTSGSESGLELPALETRRHPDISVYLGPPTTPDAQPWDAWMPEIAVEVVSESSRRRDYHDKPADYLDAGVQVYWIVDPLKRSATIPTRRSDAWVREDLGKDGVLATELLPGFSLALQAVWATLPPSP